ncbi:probable trehalase [Asparagus officinalis]|uniref:probable trehalase n=1 Tax=Asparagus officinalis TaxID=4686 RepID=UPI00098E190E|nr:probable trehalase [Asparagus officinalis]
MATLRTPGHLPKLPKSPSSLFTLLLCFSPFLIMPSTAQPPPCTGGPTRPTTPLLSFLVHLQSEALKSLGPTDFDPKLYVDLPLRRPLSVTEAAFADLPRVNGSIPVPDLHRFVMDYFREAGSDIVEDVPVDFVPEPEGFLPKVKNEKVRGWALGVHSLWKNLSRRVSDGVIEDPDLHTLLPLPEPMVVPGSRFREVYYWDSYWVIRGLLVSKMYDSAKALVRNLISLIKVYGYVLNGSRAYYSNRSEPPLLTSMVLEIYTRTGDLAFANESLPFLLVEHSFWNSGIHKVTIQDVQGQMYSLSRYYAMWNKPRPESAIIDEETASKLQLPQKEIFYREVASTAESGWDFSSRWMRNSSDMTTLSTTSIIPVDLNVYMYKMELGIAFFAKLTGDNSTSEKFLTASKARLTAMTSIFWNEEMGQWLDYWLIGECGSEDVHQFDLRNQNQNVFASNFIPLWIQENNTDGPAVDKVLKSLQTSGLIHPAGIATSLVNTGQQWDFPNGWPPLQHMIVEGLVRSGSPEARSLAEDIAIRWLKTNYAAFKKSGTMQEKYDVESCGEAGGGGEYKTQVKTTTLN